MLISVDAYDAVSEQAGIPVPALIKIDVEGAEALVIRGMQRLISSKQPPIICEISEWSQRQLGTSKVEMFQMLADYGYRPTLLTPPRQSIFSTDTIEFCYNVLFMVRE